MRVVSVDGLRGVFLLLMTLAHLQGPIASQLGKANHHRISFADAAYGFVFLSGIVLGMYLTRLLAEGGSPGMWDFVRRRLAIVYAFHVGTALSLALLAVLVAAPSGRLTRFEGLGLQDFLDIGLLFSQPSLLTILPMYLVLIAIAPVCIGMFSTGRAAWVLGASALLWLLAQFGLPQAAGVWAAETLNYPYAHYAGVFRVVAWQFIFVAGLFLGHRAVTRPAELIRLAEASARVLLPLGIIFVLLAALKLHFDILELRPDSGSALARSLMDSQSKWTASPLHLTSLGINSALILGLVGGASVLRRGALLFLSKALRWILVRRPLVRLGQSSIQAFSAHILLLYAIDHVFEPEGVAEPLRYLVLILGVGSLFLVPVATDSVRSARMRLRTSLARDPNA